MLGGLTTFVTMAYVIIVNPRILSDAGMPVEGVVFATCISAAVATLVMGLYANYPIALAPGMSLNAYFTYSVCIGMNIPWRTALGVVFFSGVLFVLLTVTRVREQIVDGIPDCLKHSTAAGIGLFIAFVGMRNAKLVVANPATFVSIGKFSDPAVQCACFGIVLTLVLMARRINGAILLGILGTTLFGIVRGIASWPSGLVAMPQPSSTFLQLDFRGAMHLGLLEIIFAFLFVDLHPGLRHCSGPDPCGSVDDAIHCARQMGGFHRSISRIYDHAGDAADVQHRHWIESRRNFVLHRKTGSGQISRSQHRALDTHGIISTPVYLSSGRV